MSPSANWSLFKVDRPRIPLVSMTAVLSEPVENRLLAALPPDEYERLRPNLRPVSFSLGEVVYEFGGQLDYVFFPDKLNRLSALHNGKRHQRRNGFNGQ